MAVSDQQQILKNAVAGSQQDFAILMQQYSAAVFRFVLRMIHDSAVAEDITQETFIKAWKSIGTFDLEKKFSTWLFQIAKNTTIDTTRKRRIPVFSDLHANNDDEVTIESVADIQPLPDEIVGRAQIVDEIRGAVDDLGPSYASVIYLHLEEDLTFAEISEILEESIDTIKSRYRRAIIKIREQFAPKL